MKLTVSDGNTKIGKVPNISFLPGVTCGADVPCRKDCYALKGCQTYSQVIPAWAGNTMLWRMRPEKFWGQLQDWFMNQKSQPEKFRWFVGGDIPDSTFLKDMNTFATANPKTKFLVFTKNVAAICDLLLMPEKANVRAPNLSLYFSAWPGWKEPQTETLRRLGVRVAWFQPKDAPDPRIPRDAFTCPGHCPQCGACWVGKKDVVFHQH